MKCKAIMARLAIIAPTQLRNMFCRQTASQALLLFLLLLLIVNMCDRFVSTITLILNSRPVETEENVNFVPHSFNVQRENYVTQGNLSSGVCTRLLLSSPYPNELPGQDSRRATFTVVTAYFNLGTFQKGISRLNQNYSTKMYFKWMSGFRSVLNDVIAFTDDEDFFFDFLDVRRQLFKARTYICLVRRETLWSYRLVPLIKDVQSQPNYPKHYPDTVIAEYGATMHSKYALMELALQSDPFESEYIAWVDSGTFRDLVEPRVRRPEAKVDEETRKEPFFLAVPHDHDHSRVALNQVKNVNFTADSVLDVYKKNSYWVGGGFFLATRDVMRRWVEQYKRATFALLEMGLSNTDQQAIYAMFHPSSLADVRFHPHQSSIVWLQTYRKQRYDQVDEWFYLPYRCRNEWFARMRGFTCNITTLKINCSTAGSGKTSCRLLAAVLQVVFIFIWSIFCK